jgi:hypothetical protein
MDEWQAADHHDHVLSEAKLPLNNPLSKFRILTEILQFADLASAEDLKGK